MRKDESNRVRLNLNIPKETYLKIEKVRDYYTKNYGIKFDITKTLTKMINDTSK